jgi:hypothetical protein
MFFPRNERIMPVVVIDHRARSERRQFAGDSAIEQGGFHTKALDLPLSSPFPNFDEVMPPINFSLESAHHRD